MSRYVLISFDFRGRMEIIRFMFAATGVKVRREKNHRFIFTTFCFRLFPMQTNLACVAERAFASVGSKGVPGTCAPGPIIFSDFMQFFGGNGQNNRLTCLL